MYKVYHGGGPPRRVEERRERPGAPASVPPPRMPPQGELDDPLRRTIESLLSRVTSDLETEDLVLLLIVYLLYRESEDTEMLIILGALLLL